MGALARLIIGFIVRRPVTTAALSIGAANAPAITRTVAQAAKLPAKAAAGLESAGQALKEAAIGAGAVGAVYVGGRIIGAWK